MVISVDSDTYLDPSLPLQQRVENLLSQMSVSERVAQLTGITSGLLYSRKQLSDRQLSKYLQAGIGQIVFLGGEGGLASPEKTGQQVAAVQKYLLEQTRLGIPAIPHIEVISGVLSPGTTNFPSGIGMAAGWKPDNLQQMTDLIRRQMLAMGYRQALSPVMDIARDARWGRVGETYGEDPYLASQMSIAFVRGLQSEDLANGVAATGKHFIGYGAPEAGLNCAAQHLNARELYEVYGRPFEAAIQEAGLASVMNSYGEIDGIPVIASREILTDLLRGRMGFDGVVVSDYKSVDRLVEPYRLAENPADAGIQALLAGLDIELPTAYGFNEELVSRIESGAVDAAPLNEAVRRVLRLKFRLGLFENPWPRTEHQSVFAEKKQNAGLSARLAAESLVLLKNEGGLLPLSHDVGRLAVIGPHADSLRNLFGCYTLPAGLDMFKGILNAQGSEEAEAFIQMGNDLDGGGKSRLSLIECGLKIIPTDYIVKLLFPKAVSILKSVRQKVSRKSSVSYAEGCKVTGEGRDGIASAVAVASQADVVILVLGGKYGWDAGCTSGEGIDATHTGLPGVQEELLRAVVATETPVVLVHMDGRPMGSVYAAEHVSACLEAWTPGQEGGRAVVDALFGDTVPGGKLPVTVPRSAGQAPIFSGHRRGSGYTNEKGMNREGYFNESFRPLYPFGHGLSYTRFEYSDLLFENPTVDPTGSLILTFKIRNAGTVSGDEVPQVYFSDRLSSVVRPNRELVAFQRITLAPQQQVTVSVKVAMPQLAFLDRQSRLIVEPGLVDVAIGSSSEDIRLRGVFEITGEVTAVERWVYSSEVTVCQ